MTAPEELRRRLERLYEGVWNERDPDVADELVASDYYIHDRSLAADLSGPALYRALAEGTRETFPDATFHIEGTVAAEDRVAVRWRMTGTHEGSLWGEPPTGRSVDLPGVEVDRFDEGLLAETWTQSDMLGLARAVGAVSFPDEDAD
jgi:steroid delta-isomerase-like uncharacterized protein